jgi:hypothetical protein
MSRLLRPTHLPARYNLYHSRETHKLTKALGCQVNSGHCQGFFVDGLFQDGYIAVVSHYYPIEQ